MTRRFAGFIVLTSLLCPAVFAQVPDLIAYQGRLVDDVGLVNGTVGLALTLYDGGGVMLYRDSNQVTVVDGLYSTFIGDDPPSAAFAAAFTNAELYVETEVNGVALTPRERIAAVGYAIRASDVSTGSIVPASLDLPRFSNTFWSAEGNPGTTAGTHFLGTTDDEPLELKVNSARALRLEPTSGSPNVIGGHATNAVTSGATGATISGGGGTGGAWNRVTDDFGTIGGGRNNQAGDGAGATDDASFCTVGGGRGNVASGPESVVAGGKNNAASGTYAVVSGGATNSAAGTASVVAGGMNNAADGSRCAVLGGLGNVVSNGANHSAICAGQNNSVATILSFIGSGSGNQIEPVGPEYAGANQGCAIVSGFGNRAESQMNFIGSGYHNSALGFRSVIVGGEQNTTYEWFGFIGGGDANKVYTNYSGVVCGYANVSSNNFTFIGGGRNNLAEGAHSSILGGRANTAAAAYSAVVGGYQAAATHYGELAHASGCFTGRGDAQSSSYVLRRTSTGTTTTELFLDPSSSVQLTLAEGRAMTFDVLVTAMADNDQAAAYHYTGGIKRTAAGTTSLIGSVTEIMAQEDDPAWSVTVDADTFNNALRLQCAGAAGRSIRWVASVRTAEVTMP